MTSNGPERDVIVRCSQFKNGYFCRGTVLGLYDSNLAKVQLYANKKRYKIKIHMIMKMVEEESLSVNDYVLCAVRDEDDDECFIPGIVDHVQSQRFYSIKYFNGQNGINLINRLMKVDRVQYDLIVDYIVLKLGMKKYNVVNDLANMGQTTRRIEMKNFNDLMKNETNSSDKNLSDDSTENVLYFNNGDLLDLNLVKDELFRLRFTLSDIDINTEVIARSTVDGFYYKQTVKQYCANRKYILVDSNGLQTEAYRENMITFNTVDQYFQINDTIIGLLPNCDSETCIYAPGIVMGVSNDHSVVVRFYDGQETVLCRAFRIPIFKFEYDVKNIIELEKLWLGERVIAFNPLKCKHEIGTIVQQIGFKRRFLVQWFNLTSTILTSNDFYGKYTVRLPIRKDDCVLAFDYDNDVFLPGIAVNRRGDEIHVKLMDGRMIEDSKVADCFKLTKKYYSSILSATIQNC